VVTTSGLTFEPAEFDRHLVEEQVEHSTALHSRLAASGDCYVVGPLARYSLCSDLLSPLAAEVAGEAGLGPTCRNPFRSIVVRAVETVYACEEALRIIDGWDGAAAAAADVQPRAGIGYGATEAPRGTLFHRYQLAEDGTILDARIVPPTAQNQASIEADLKDFVQANLALEHEQLRHRCEQAIRSYDPCISCATHFLELEVERS
jgi:coenzyme F420-reducing hydrogenase alpha subunit